MSMWLIDGSEVLNGDRLLGADPDIVLGELNAVARLHDICTGHGAYPARVNDGASPNVFVNGRGAHRVGDHWVIHCNPVPACHDSVLAAGSTSVFINGMALGRVGDPIACGSLVASGSGDVFCG